MREKEKRDEGVKGTKENEEGRMEERRKENGRWMGFAVFVIKLVK